MSDDPIGNINLNVSNSVHAINHSEDRPIKREKQKKRYTPKRKHDQVEITGDQEELRKAKVREVEMGAEPTVETEKGNSINIVVR